MPIRLDEIKGLMVDKIKCADFHDDIRYGVYRGWQQCVDQQSSRKIKINPEKLAKLLHSKYMELIEPLEIAKDLRDWDNLTYQKECWLEDARAIIANEAELLEYVE